MGVPKFFRWLSERYPKINQRFGSMPEKDTYQRYFDPHETGVQEPPPPFEVPDQMAMCTIPPEIDRLYIDMNGIIHGCSHNNNTKSNEDDSSESFDTVSKISNEEIFRNVCYYLDRLIGDMVQPKQIVYMAIDGVAPRAKLNQQRSRRYRSGKEGSIESTIYDAHEEKMRQKEEQKSQLRRYEDDLLMAEEGITFVSDTEDDSDEDDPRFASQQGPLQEIAPGRFKGKFLAETQIVEGEADDVFHSNAITPGTPFFSEFTKHLEHFCQYKISTDPKWQNLTIIFSGPNVPGEGEHKIMQFIREQKTRKDYDPNLKHCIMGQDGDLVMLGLATHEPNLVLLRERVVFNMIKQKLMAARVPNALDLYIHNPHFEFLHMGVLRDYLSYEFETSGVISSSPYDLERTIDDFVFMTFFVGNDFLPHMPALDIGDNAFDLLFANYKKRREIWAEEDPDNPYLTYCGEIVSGRRLEDFVRHLGAHEVSYFDKKKLAASQEYERMRKESRKYGHSSSIPSDETLKSKEESDRAAYREMLQQKFQNANSAASIQTTAGFTPVLTESVDFRPSKDEDNDSEGMESKMGALLQQSIDTMDGGLDDQDLKGRYYYDKFQFTPFDADKHMELRKAYIEGLVWNLKYYYEGCVSWEWFYPYHYGPMLSDLVGLDSILEGIDFSDKLGKPLKPFQQLMGCMPPSQASHLPEPYRWLMTDPSSPIIDFYPTEFLIDMNGKRWPWEAVVLLPFIDSKRLLDASAMVDSELLTEEEKTRNAEGSAVALVYDSSQSMVTPAVNDGLSCFGAISENRAKKVPFEQSQWRRDSDSNHVLKPVVSDKTTVPLPGYGSLRDGPVQSLWKRGLGINVFGSRSRYKTASLEMSMNIPPLPTVNEFAPDLIGSSIFVNYPYFVEGLVTSVSDENVAVRGRKAPVQKSPEEASFFRTKLEGLIRLMDAGEGFTGSGGIIIGNEEKVIVTVRPLLRVTNIDGTDVKEYAKFELEVPLSTTFWVPSNIDQNLANLPRKIEKNAFEIALEQPVEPPTSNDGRIVLKSLLPPKGAKPSAGFLAYDLEDLDSDSSDDTDNNSDLDELEPQDVAAVAARTSSTEPRRKKKSNAARKHYQIRHEKKKKLKSRSFSSMSASQWQVRDTLVPVVSTAARRTFTTKATLSCAQKQQSMPRKAPLSPKPHPLGPGVRGKLLVAGAVACASFFGLAQAVSPRTMPLTMCASSILPSCPKNPWWNIRGGDIMEKEDVLGTDPTEASAKPLEFEHGTTTLSFTFSGGIIAAVDSRASIGNFVGSKTVEKVLPVNKYMLGTMAGGAADCMFWIRKLKADALAFELKHNKRMSVARASRMLSDMLYRYRGTDLTVGTMIMGFDEEGPPRIYYVDSTGLRIEGDMFAVGSGSNFALGILDNERRPDMSREEAVALGIKAIRHATFRDAFSGGFINVYVITRDGWEKVFSEDIAHRGQGEIDGPTNA